MSKNYNFRNYPIKLRDTTLVAKFIGVSENQLFKSLIIIKDNLIPILVMIPSNTKLNLKQLEIELDLKLLNLATREQAETLTGMQVGGISPLGLLEIDIPIYITQSVTQYDWIVFSAGERGVTAKMLVSELLKITKAKLVTDEVCLKKS